ncbi:MAG: hypothetical protein F4X56_00490 [Gammaproteobacteria bacterium]|nr:hypothetical protein [Gammaproteobacteria bacterium]
MKTESFQSLRNVCGVLLIVIGTFTFGFMVALLSLSQDSEERRSDRNEFRSDTAQYTTTKASAPTLQLIENQTNKDSHFDRRHTLHNLFAKANSQELELYFSQSKNLVSLNFLRVVQDQLIQRWSVLDPQKALSLVIEEFTAERQIHLVQLVFKEWSRSNLSNAIKHAQQLDNNLIDVVVDSMVTSREDLSVEQRRDIARELKREWRAIEILRHENSEAVIKAPAQEWAAFVREQRDTLSSLDEAQLRMMGYIALSWVTLEGTTVMAHLREELPRTTSLLATTEFVARELMETQPDKALELVVFAASIDHDLGYQDLAIELIGSWAGNSLDQALDATLEIEAESLRWELQKKALEAAAEIDVFSLLSSLERLPEHLRDRAYALAIAEIAKKSPESAAEMLPNVSKLEERKLVTEAIVKRWALKDIDATIRWIETTSKLPIDRNKLKETAFQELVALDWRLAFETALSLPVNSKGAGWEGTVVQWLANRNSDLAESLLVRVRPGPGRVEAFDGIIFNALHDRDYHRALEVFLQLCELEEHSDQSIFLMPLTLTVPDLVLSSIDKIASRRAKVEVADWLIYEYANTDMFTPEEMKRIRQIASLGKE